MKTYGLSFFLFILGVAVFIPAGVSPSPQLPENGPINLAIGVVFTAIGLFGMYCSAE